jgi:hypothetical protein
MVTYSDENGDEVINEDEVMIINIPGFDRPVGLEIAQSDRVEFWNFAKDIFKMKCKESRFTEDEVPGHLSLSILTAMEFHKACPQAFHKPQHSKPQRHSPDLDESISDNMLDDGESPFDISM